MRRNELEGMLLLILMGYMGTSIAENRPYGFGSPINVGSETSFGLSSPYGGYSAGSIGNARNFGTGLSGLSSVYGSGASAVGYGLNSYPALNGYNNFNHHGLGVAQNSRFYAGVGSGTGTGFGGNFYPSGSHLGSGFGTGFGGNFYPSGSHLGSGFGTGFGGNFYPSGSHLGSGFGAYNLHRVPYSYNNGLGNYGTHSGIGLGVGNGNGFSLSAGFNGLGGHFGGSIGYGGNYGNGYEYDTHQAFK